MTDRYDYKPVWYQISTLMHIRESLKNDNELSLKVAKCGKFTAMRDINDAIETILRLERNYLIFRSDFEIYKEQCQEYSDFLSGYTPDILEDERKAEVKALVEKWQKEDEEDET